MTNSPPITLKDLVKLETILYDAHAVSAGGPRDTPFTKEDFDKLFWEIGEVALPIVTHLCQWFNARAN